MTERTTHPLSKEVPGHLLQFEEKLFGMTLAQLLTDLGIVGMTVMLTGSLPLVAHLVVDAVIILVALILVHGKVAGYTMLSWLYLLARFWLLPTSTVWRAQGMEAEKGAPRSVQQTWLPMQVLEHGIMGMVTPGKREGTSQATCWVVFQVESVQNVRYLAEAEQVKLYERFKSFLDGLSFPLKCLSLVEQVDPQTDPALLAQDQALQRLSATPRLRRAQQASLDFQRSMLAHCTASRHFVVVAASTAEVARLRTDGQARSTAQQLWARLSPTRSLQVTPEQV